MKCSILYSWSHEKLYNKFGCGIIEDKEASEIIGELFHIPKNLRVPIIKEMINLDLLERVDSTRIKINPLKVDFENTSKIYASLKIF